MIRANVHQPYFRKHLFIALGGFAYAAWCLYDGLVAYPRNLEIAEAFEAIPDDAKRVETWTQLASERGWSADTPVKSAAEVASLISGQFFFAAICATVGIVALIIWARARGTWVEGDESQIRSSWGDEIAIPSITKINKRKWPEKGIARLYYEENGKKGRFVMDDFKYDSTAMGQILTFAEAHLSADDVVGDRLERDKAADAIASAEASAGDDVDDEYLDDHSDLDENLEDEIDEDANAKA